MLATPAISSVRFADDTAYYHGPISSELNHQLFEVHADRTIRRLVITSSGGEVRAGIELGTWVYEQQLDVGVPEYCLSSCANYVFPAGRNKSIEQGAVVAWHGNYHHLQHTGLWKDDIEARMQRTGVDRKTATQQLLDQVNDLVDRERQFFKLIGVDQHLCWVGKMPPYSAPDYYFLTSDDMAGFGVRNVQAPEKYENTGLTDFNVHIMYIQLDGHPE